MIKIQSVSVSSIWAGTVLEFVQAHFSMRPSLNMFFCKQIAATFPAARLPLSNADFGVGMILARESEKGQTEKKNIFL